MMDLQQQELIVRYVLSLILTGVAVVAGLNQELIIGLIIGILFPTKHANDTIAKAISQP